MKALLIIIVVLIILLLCVLFGIFISKVVPDESIGMLISFLGGGGIGAVGNKVIVYILEDY